MGLDVYLYKCDNFAKKAELEAAYEKESESHWKGGDMTDAEKEMAHEADEESARRLGLGEYGAYPEDKIERDSALYPEHYCKVGYFRSSYNDGGFNSIARRMGLPSLYDMLPHDDNDYLVRPDWKACLDIATSAVLAWKEAAKNCKYDCMEVSHNIFKQVAVKDEKGALKLFDEQVTKSSGSFRSYSSGDGVFYLDGLKCAGFIPGIGSLGAPCVYIIYEREAGSLDYYVQTAEIVKETIEFVLSQPDPQLYYLHWSG